MNKENTGSELTLRIDWSELDYFGHVNNVEFFKYIQSSRINYWDCIGLRKYHLEENIGPLLASSKCDFKKPLFFPGNIQIFANVTKIGNSSFTLNHSIYDDSNDLAAEAIDVMVMFDFNLNKKIQFPNFLKNKIELLEKRSF